MEPNSIVIYFVTILISAGVIIGLFYRFRYAVSDLESKVTGIWANEANTMRILIYGFESRFQAEVVWTSDIDDRILGTSIIRNMTLKYFSWGEGIYICPFTQSRFDFKLKLKKSGRLHFRLFEQANATLTKTEVWRPVI